jgi:hypothetical protein
MKLAILFLCVVVAYGQAVISLTSPGKGKPGKNTVLTLSVTGSTAAGASGFQWSLVYPAGYAATIVLGAAAASAGKALNCTPDKSTCVLSGLNTNVIPDGVLATYALHIPKGATAGSVAVGFSNLVGTSSNGMAISVLPGAAFYVP